MITYNSLWYTVLAKWNTDQLDTIRIHTCVIDVQGNNSLLGVTSELMCRKHGDGDIDTYELIAAEGPMNPASLIIENKKSFQFWVIQIYQKVRIFVF